MELLHLDWEWRRGCFLKVGPDGLDNLVSLVVQLYELGLELLDVRVGFLSFFEPLIGAVAELGYLLLLLLYLCLYLQAVGICCLL